MQELDDWQRRLPVPVTTGRAVTICRTKEQTGRAVALCDGAEAVPAGPAVPSGSRALVPVPTQRAAARAFAQADRAYRRALSEDELPPLFDLTV